MKYTVNDIDYYSTNSIMLHYGLDGNITGASLAQ